MIGTKLHQQTRQGMARRRPKLTSLINEYNSCCDQIESLAGNPPRVPIPAKLPTLASKLKEDENLFLDVQICIDGLEMGEEPLWMKESVRKAMKNYQITKQVTEEKIRLRKEAENLINCYGEELTVAEVTVRISKPELEGLEGKLAPV